MATVGLIGSGLVILAYFANQQGWMSASGWRYSALNLAGALLILASLFAEWNTPSVFIEAFWAVISLYGLLRWAARRKLERSARRA
jgi:hypothetical protein